MLTLILAILIAAALRSRSLLRTAFDGRHSQTEEEAAISRFDMKPEMSAYEVCDAVVDAINSDKYDVILLNYANCDMVGHTGVFDAAVAAVEAVDNCVGRTVDAIREMGGYEADEEID